MIGFLCGFLSFSLLIIRKVKKMKYTETNI